MFQLCALVLLVMTGMVLSGEVNQAALKYERGPPQPSLKAAQVYCAARNMRLAPVDGKLWKDASSDNLCEAPMDGPIRDVIAKSYHGTKRFLKPNDKLAFKTQQFKSFLQLVNLINIVTKQQSNTNDIM